MPGVPEAIEFRGTLCTKRGRLARKLLGARLMPSDDRFDRVRASLLTGSPCDGAFDRLLPALAHAKSRQYWSPLCAARRAAMRFAERGARRVLDVGSGPGKFCIGAAFARPDLHFCGVEQRQGLVETAKELAYGLKLRNLEFKLGNALSARWDDFDGFYFFNPFAENAFSPQDIFDETVRLSGLRQGAELLRVTELLSSLPCGATVITYCGLGGPIPSSYDLLSEELVSSGCLRTWVRRRASEAGWYHLDHHDDVSRAPRRYVERKLERPLPLFRVTAH